jgi:hypothetical protein
MTASALPENLSNGKHCLAHKKRTERAHFYVTWADSIGNVANHSSNAGGAHAVAVWRAVGQRGALVPAIRSGLNGVGVPANSSFQDSTIDIGIGAE